MSSRIFLIGGWGRSFSYYLLLSGFGVLFLDCFILPGRHLIGSPESIVVLGRGL